MEAAESKIGNKVISVVIHIAILLMLFFGSVLSGAQPVERYLQHGDSVPALNLTHLNEATTGSNYLIDSIQFRLQSIVNPHVAREILFGGINLTGQNTADSLKGLRQLDSIKG